MTDIINKYGDKLIETTGAHGADISSQRMDDLDISSLTYALSLKKGKKTALDLGCGKGFHSLRLALLGVNVHMYDILDITQDIDLIKKTIPLSDESLSFYNKKIEDVIFDSGVMFDIVYSQRFIHYLRYDAAVELVKKIYNHTLKDGKVFISASGMNSELSSNYSCKNYPIQKRFGLLSDEMADTHGIKMPVCLYYPHELDELFLSEGFKTVKTETSLFGNVKAIFQK